MTYDSISAAVEGAGFFATHDPDVGRLICASLRRPDGGLSGNSCWVAKRSSGWFLGTWGPRLYRIPDATRMSELCTSWLQRQPRDTSWSVDDAVRHEFGLIE